MVIEERCRCPDLEVPDADTFTMGDKGDVGNDSPLTAKLGAADDSLPGSASSPVPAPEGSELAVTCRDPSAKTVCETVLVTQQMASPT